MVLRVLRSTNQAMKFSRIVRIIALLLIPTLTCNTLTLAQPKPMSAAAVKAKLDARGVGKGVRITLLDKTEFKGSIISVGDTSCSLSIKGKDQPTTVAYSDVTGVHNDKMSAGKKVGLGVGIAVGALVVVAVVIVLGGHVWL